MLALVTLTVLLAGVVFVSASMVPTSPLVAGSNKADYNVEIEMVKGWNLIVASPLYGNNANTITSDSEIKQENIKAIFYYFRHESRYLEIYPNSTDMDDYLHNIQGKIDEVFYFVQTPIWIYSNKDGILKYTRNEFPTIDLPALTQGWNFVTISPAMEGKTLSDIKGNCNVTGAYNFGKVNTADSASSWIPVQDNVFSSDVLGQGMVIKVSNDCALGSSLPVVNPPIPPILPGNNS